MLRCFRSSSIEASTCGQRYVAISADFLCPIFDIANALGWDIIQSTVQHKSLYSHANLLFRLQYVISSVRAIVPIDSTVSPVSRVPVPRTQVDLEYGDSLQFDNRTSEIWRLVDSQSTQYTGQASPQLDAAWRRLLWGEFPAVSDEEIAQNRDLAGAFTEEDRNPLTGKFHIALDVFHSLHCVNEIRKELERTSETRHSWTKNNWSPSSQQQHIAHCLNHIRQSLQCRPDLTPAPMKRFLTAEGHDLYLADARRHSCLNWDAIREWLDERRRSDLGGWENEN